MLPNISFKARLLASKSPLHYYHYYPFLRYSGSWIATVPLPSPSYNVVKYTNVHVIMKLYSEALLKLKTLFDQAHHARLYSRTLVTRTRKGTEKR